MTFLKLTMAAALIAASLGTIARAQDDDPVLEGLVQEAIARNPRLAAAHYMATAAGTRADQAGSRPGPMLGASYQNDGWALSLGERDMTMLSLDASQELPYPGKRGLRRDVAQADAALAAFDLDREKLSVIGAVKRAYYGLRLARALAGVAEQQRDTWQEVQEAARARYASAVGEQLELVRAQVERTRVQALHAQHHAQARARLAELNLLLSRPADT